ncbi:MAG TPA: zf-TFIIB domain-containing protein [bacterium]|nr:zf-TFIIB domain-containing protein [bacterium]
MRLVLCPACDTQYDVTQVTAEEFPCRCGAMVKNESLPGVDARILRCGSCGAAVPGDAHECAYCGAAILRTGGTRSLICPKCFARNDEESHYCTSCGIRFQPEQVELAVALLPCVRGCGTMAAQTAAGLPVHECTHCHGLWIPEHRLDELIERAAQAPALFREQRESPWGLPPVEYRRCPVCNALMARRNFRRISGVVIDSCHEHGTWLDADELERIAEFVRAGGLVRAAEHDAHERVQLAKSAGLRARLERGTPEQVRAEARLTLSRPLAKFLNKLFP